MFLRSTERKKDGKVHTYYSVVENRRVADDKVTQRTVLYLGEISHLQEAAWQDLLDRFDSECQGHPVQPFRQQRLWGPQRLRPDEVDAIGVQLSQMELRRPRAFGSCWLGCEIWRLLELDEFWREKLPEGREGVAWHKVIELLAVNRLVDPGSEWRLHRQWFDQSAMDELLEADSAVASKDRLYRCLDRLLAHKQELFRHLKQRWQTLFGAQFELLLYDLTSTYVEGAAELNPKAKRGYSRDRRPDCLQVIIGLVITTEGFPIAYEVMEGNTADSTTLPGFLDRIEQQYGRAQRVWIMDRGIPTEALLAQLRASQREIRYLVGTPRGLLNKYEQALVDRPWHKVNEAVQVKLLPQDGEVLVLAKSGGRQAKERAMRRRKLARLLRKLRALRQRPPRRDPLLLRLGAAKTAAGRAFQFVRVQLPKPGEAVTRQTFTFQLDKEKLQQAQLRDGHYLLRTNLSADNPEQLWKLYMQLTQIEAAFRCLKTDLKIRPIHHQLEQRVDAHILVAFLSYCLMVTLKKRLEPHGPGLTPKAALEKLASIQMIDVCIPTTQGAWLVLPRYTQPSVDQHLLLKKLNLELPQQPPPRIETAEAKESWQGLRQLKL
jgi:Transposase DDE domain